MKDRVLIFLYETQCFLKELSSVFCALFGIKLKNSDKIDWVDKLLMLLILILYSVFIFLLIKFDDLVATI